MIYFTAIGLTPGGSNTVHLHTEQHNKKEYPERNVHNNTYTEQ